MKTSPKHRWSLSHNYLAGITAGDWVRLLRANRWEVDAVYWHRAAVISLLSVWNAWNRRREERLFAAAVEETEVAEPPVFILGHWRSGTTHLHNLLACDDARFAFPNTYQVVNPHTFLTTEEANTRRFAWMLPAKRPMDNVALDFRSPQEDEFAPLLDCLLSPYLGVTFPRREGEYERFLSFKEASADERERWKRSFGWFVKKLTHRYGGRRLLLKSPAHTARIAILREMWPEAKFVHIHRRPEEVFQSFRHYYDTAVWFTYLQRPEGADFDERIVRRYQAVYDAFFADVGTIPAGNFHEVAFRDLEADPLGTVRGIYEGLGIPGVEQAMPKVEAYVGGVRGYEKNRFAELTEEERGMLREAWGPYYRRWGYEIE